MNVHKELAMGEVGLVKVDRQRRWTRKEKQDHIARAFSPGVKVRAYAKQAGVAPSSLYKWREEEQGRDVGFTEVEIKTEEAVVCRQPDIMELALSNGIHLRIPPTIPIELATSVVKALVRR